MKQTELSVGNLYRATVPVWNVKMGTKSTHLSSNSRLHTTE